VDDKMFLVVARLFLGELYNVLSSC